MYMHMLRPTSVEELKEFRPSLGQNLHDMVSYKEDDFEDIYDLTFSVSKFRTLYQYAHEPPSHTHIHIQTHTHIHTHTRVHTPLGYMYNGTCSYMYDTM